MAFLCVRIKMEKLRAKNVVVATGPFHTPYTPPCHTKASETILQIHSNYYKGLYQLQDGDALVVGRWRFWISNPKRSF